MRANVLWGSLVAVMVVGCGDTTVVGPPVDAGPGTHVVVVRVLGDGAGHVEGDGMLDCDGDSGGRCYAIVEHHATLHLEAGAEEGSVMGAWSASACGSDAACDLTVDADMTVEVTFTRVDDGRAALRVLTAGNGEGDVTSAPVGLDCDVECSARFTLGEVVTLTASPRVGSDFIGWSGACSGSAPECSFTLTEASLAVAAFEARIYDIDVDTLGAGQGAITSQDADIDCGSACHAHVAHGDEVTLHAVPEAGSSLLSWGGACASAGTALTCQVTVTEALSVTASFGLARYDVVVTRTGDGSGSVAATGIACGNDCSEEVGHGAVLTFTQTTATGSVFAGWGGDCSGTGACSVTASDDVNVSAEFDLLRYTHTVNVVGERSGAGRVTSTPAGIDCSSGTCTHDFAHGQLVTFTATPEDGSTFAGWTDSAGTCTGTGPCAVMVGQARTLTAAFEGHTTVTLDPSHRDPQIRLRSYDLLAADLDLDFGGVRSNVSIAPGSGVFYFEGHRLTSERGAYGVGVCSGSYDLVGTNVGSTDQAFGVTATGGIDGNGMFQGFFDGAATEYYGMVVDYRGANPIVHAITRDPDWSTGMVRPHVVESYTMSAVTTPVFILVAGQRTVTGEEIEINAGNDTTNFPFHYDVDAILRAEGLADEADELVMGWGSTYAALLDDVPTVTVSANQSVGNGASATVTASALDAEDGDLTASITWELLSSPYYLGRVTGSGASFTFTARGVGIHPARARVVDSAGHVTESIVRVTVGGPVAHQATVQLAADSLSGAGVVLDGTGTQARYTGFGKMGIRANQSCYGCFGYYEFSRLHSPGNMGGGLVTGLGNLNPFDPSDVPQSLAINVQGGAWRNLIPKANFPGPASTVDTYGVAVDYRGEHPIVYVIVGGELIYERELDDVWTEVYPMLYGNPLGTAVGSYDESINFGGSPFVYDAVTILNAEGVDTTGLTLGWD